MINWHSNPDRSSVLDEFFKGDRQLFFIFYCDESFSSRLGDEIQADCHVVMKRQDGLAIPCWSTHELATAVAKSLPHPVTVQKLNEFAFFLSVQNLKKAQDDLMPQRLHFVE